MSQFTTPLIGSWNDEMTLFTLSESFVYYVGSLNSNEFIKVPVGFETDFASIPKCFQWLFPPIGKYGKAAVVHDYLYCTGSVTKEYADYVFYEAMGVLKVPNYIRRLMYYAVRKFGKSNFKN